MPIGVFHAEARYSQDVPRQGVLAGENTGVIALERQYAGTIDDLAGFARLWVLFLFDRAAGIWHPKVKPPRHLNRKVGVFASRSPYRPNPVGLSCVRIVAVESRALRITVAGHDLLDGTPVIDIKPYLPYADAFPGVVAGWTEQHEQEYAVSIAPAAALQLEWLAARGVGCLHEFITDRLGITPMDRQRNRLVPAGGGSGGVWLAYRTWRVAFDCDERCAAVYVRAICSGYTAEQMAEEDDRYGDKALHRAFRAQFPQ